MTQVPEIKWCGWGDPSIRLGFDDRPQMAAFLKQKLGITGAIVDRPVELSSVSVPKGRLTATTRARLIEILGAEGLLEDDDARIRHTLGKSYRDLVRLRRGELPRPPDAIVRPATREALIALVEEAASAKLGLIPFGAGSSVVGGIEPVETGLAAVLCVDLTRLDRLIELDERSRTARFETGIYGRALERKLEVHGYTLGHFPQSFEFSTLGGWVAARSAGQNSSRYGKIEHMVEALEMVHPSGVWRIRPVPARASGPEWRELLVGSEGVLGIINEATVRIHPIPEAQDHRAVLFRDFEAAVNATREMVQADVQPTIMRTNDPTYTEMGFSTLGGTVQKVGSMLRGGLGMIGYGVPGASLMLLGFEGSDAEVRYQREEAGRIIRRNGGLPLGAAPARAWIRERFAHPYMRDDMMDRGMLIETLETATNWSNVHRLHQRVRSVLEETAQRVGGAALVLAHISHVYPEGASLYFTFMTRAKKGEELEQLHEIKQAAGDALLSVGATISHHHGIGMDHAPWMAEERGPSAMRSLAALKHELDPHSIMNPGKLGMGEIQPASKAVAKPAAKKKAASRKKAPAKKKPAKKKSAKKSS